MTTTVPVEQSDYAHPEKLVSTQWVAEHKDHPNVVVLESNEDTLLYSTGHIPGAVKIDWHTELNDPVTRDFIGPEAFANMAASKGISPDTTVIFYGDKSNWWAAYALWVFTLYGHEDVRLMNGGRDKWIAEGREITRDVPEVTQGTYPVVERNDNTERANKAQVLESIGELPLIDVRSNPEYTGETTHMAGYPQEGTLRGGHIPTAESVPWATAANEDGTFKSRGELHELYAENANLGKTDKVIVYCRIGERSAHTWFVLRYLLGYESVRNYDGSWTEWGNSVGLPIVVGPQPGQAPS
ncbi:sulfurtransferase [Enteractinococcus coprophilus]|uniref:Sulfurtransferase n=1 Tax=Enteractinococcus coprophilus TaxID=1027633 RepID=A0A543AJ16_9MICC|nr:sulfurtransferase [Enteractinococcus coprophilus]TQL72578.1 thiosulfate/3-mercaptopyruvate sulfurtransferase [Enteractinococcus coprophilus]